MQPEEVAVPPELAYEVATEQLARTTDALVLARAAVRYLAQQLHDARAIVAAQEAELQGFRVKHDDDQEEGVGDGPEGGGNAGDGRGGDRPEDVPE